MKRLDSTASGGNVITNWEDCGRKLTRPCGPLTKAIGLTCSKQPKTAVHNLLLTSAELDRFTPCMIVTEGDYLNVCHIFNS